MVEYWYFVIYNSYKIDTLSFNNNIFYSTESNFFNMLGSIFTKILINCGKKKVRLECTLSAFEMSIDHIFSIAMFAICIISWTEYSPCWAETMLSIVVWSEDMLDLLITISWHFSLTFSLLASSIFTITQIKQAANVLPTHSLHCLHSVIYFHASKDHLRSWKFFSI